MIYLQLNEIDANLIASSLIEQTAQSVLDHQGIASQPDLSIVITGDTEIQELNREFLGIDAPTDVLSFPSDELDPDTGNRYLGDVLISYPQAEAQAHAGGHSVASELQLLVVHGVLHLLGHDHADKEQQLEMWTAQAEILAQIKNPLSQLFS